MIIELRTTSLNIALPEGQAQTLQLLGELGEGTYSLQEIVQRSNLCSPLPLYSRLRHLEKRGLIRTTDPSASDLPASVLLQA